MLSEKLYPVISIVTQGIVLPQVSRQLLVIIRTVSEVHLTEGSAEEVSTLQQSTAVVGRYFPLSCGGSTDLQIHSQICSFLEGIIRPKH